MKKYLPIGIQDYCKLRIENYYTVDKTMIINEFLERKAEVTDVILFSRRKELICHPM